VRNVDDRVETTGIVFLGLTIGCARCHDHKYDPITMKDFYGMFAFFNSLDSNPMDGNAAKYPPIVPVPKAEQKQQLDTIRAKIADAERHRRDRSGQVDADLAAWLRETERMPKEAIQSELPKQGLVAHYPLDEKRGDQVTNAAADRFHGKV